LGNNERLEERHSSIAIRSVNVAVVLEQRFMEPRIVSTTDVVFSTTDVVSRIVMGTTLR